MFTKLITSAAVALQCRKGVTAAEYAILAAGICVVVAAAATSLGPLLNAKLAGIFS
ncbi:hypothetical protein J8J14_10930 [Roseomonas sp. SSH11]|uniref:Flp family type IVb pilin n=1 Tax=Pararoseomonas baculiformis TaxID=2820812 RepID=A0ABS4AE51_9PROT|nr:Flp family type IVb pilin [Pararoseomonas baculiformis]MBP0445292.1 hypothetical protein [Pararoseomonas baculiformis]